MQPHSNHQEEPADGRKFVQGLLIGLAAAIPLWAALGVVGILYFQPGPIREYQRIALLVTALAEVLLVGYVWRTLRPGLWLRQAVAGPGSRAAALHRPALKRTMLLAGLVGAYLHYYFWDVQLQVASLRHVVVFLPA